MFATRALPKYLPVVLGGSTAAVGGFMLFVHLMQSNAAVNEAVGNISPTVAAMFGCSCPFCSRSPACSIPANEIGVNRLEFVQVKDLMGR